MMTEERLSQMINEILDDDKIFIYKVEIKPNHVFQIFLDGDDGLPINTIASINRKLYKKIEELEEYADGDFSIEVSSPGVDMPLLYYRQYAKHIGRTLEVTSTEDVNTEGKLVELDEEQLILEVIIDKKKKATEKVAIPFQQIKHAIVQIQF